MLKVELTNDFKKLDRQIKALESVLAKDTPSDMKIHLKAIKELKAHRKELNKQIRSDL